MWKGGGGNVKNFVPPISFQYLETWHVIYFSNTLFAFHNLIMLTIEHNSVVNSSFIQKKSFGLEIPLKYFINQASDRDKFMQNFTALTRSLIMPRFRGTMYLVEANTISIGRWSFPKAFGNSGRFSFIFNEFLFIKVYH